MVARLGVILLLLAVVSGSAFAERSVELSALRHVEQRWYVDGEPVPFSGTAIRRYASGVTELEVQYRNGLRHGKETAWYSSGALKHVVRYRRGEPQSLGSSWHSEITATPAPVEFALCSEHPDLGDVCGEAEATEASHFESCRGKRC